MPYANDNKVEQKIADVINNMATKDARRIGLSKRHLFRLKKRQLFRLKKKVNEGKRIVLKRKTLVRLNRYA